MQKALVVGLALLMASAALAGCAADQPEEATSGPTDDCGPADQQLEPDSPRAKSDVDRPPGC